MPKIIEVFNYIFNTVRQCSGNEFNWKECTISARYYFDDIGDDVYDITVENDTYNTITLKMSDLSDSYIEIECDTESNYKYSKANINDSWDSVSMAYNIDECIGFFEVLYELYTGKWINPHYEDRIWSLYSFGDNYMKYDFDTMAMIKRVLWEKQVYIAFHTEDNPNSPGDKIIDTISFLQYPDKAELLTISPNVISFKDSKCHIRGILPDNGEIVNIILYEELNIDKR